MALPIRFDGYIALPNGDISWLREFEGGKEDYGYSDFYSTLSAVIMGSKTYEQALTFGNWPYTNMPTYVITKHKIDKKFCAHCKLSNLQYNRKFANKPDKSVIFYNGDLKKLVQDLKKKNERDVWLVGGSKLVTSFMNQNLIDEYIISIIPVILREGIPMFKDINHKRRLALVETKTYSSGIVQLRYH